MNRTDRVHAARERIDGVFRDVAVHGCLHAVELDGTGEVGLRPDERVVLGSVFKLPIALAYARVVSQGGLDPLERVTVTNADRSGGTGTSGCADDVELSWRDVARLMLTISDNAATDVLLRRVGLSTVQDVLDDLELAHTHVQGSVADLFASVMSELEIREPAELESVAPERIRALSVLDPTLTSASTPRDMTRLLAALWSDDSPAAGDVRAMLAAQGWDNRLASGFGSDVRVAAKTGTLLTVRNEVGVVTYPDGRRYAVAAFTRADEIVERRPDVDAAIGEAARLAVEALRDVLWRPRRSDGGLYDLAQVDAAMAVQVADEASGLRAVIVIDDLSAGLAVGGTRTRRYRAYADALSDAAALSAAMTEKSALAGVDVGGAKVVVLDHPGFDRAAGFRRLGRAVEDLGGRFGTAGDLGTHAEDLQAMAEETRYVVTDEPALGLHVAEGFMHSLRAAADHAGLDLPGLRAAVQGCGAMGAAVARLLAAEGVRLLVADLDEGAARALADETGGQVVQATGVLLEDVDIVVPCATGGVITEPVARELGARIVCGVANNALASDAAARVLMERGVVHVPDPISSAGGVIAGLAVSVFGLRPAIPGLGQAELLARLGDVTQEVLVAADAEERPPATVSRERAKRIVTERRTLALAQLSS